LKQSKPRTKPEKALKSRDSITIYPRGLFTNKYKTPMTKSKIYILNRKTVPFQRHYSFSSSGAVSIDRGIDSATKATNCFSHGEHFTANARRPLLYSCNNACILWL